MRYAAFDLSKTSGIAVWDTSWPMPRLDHRTAVGWEDSDVGFMCERWRVWLADFIAEHNPDAIGFETGYFAGHGDGFTQTRQVMLAGWLQWACYVKRIEPHPIGVGAWRSTFLGFARNKTHIDWKTLAKRRCDQLGWQYPDHNAAEAGGILDHLTHKLLKISTPWRADPFLPLIES